MNGRDLFNPDAPHSIVARATGVDTKPRRKPTKANGYAWKPGTGPAGETCKTCAHYTRVQHAKVYLKCGLMRSVWTNGPGTDIKASSPACEKWTANEQRNG
jgi:hypothetical protein